MIEECPINMECKLIKTVDFPSHDIFIGKVMATYRDDSILSEGVVDLAKSQPILFAMNDRSYWMVCERLASAWSIGKSLKDKK
jgi:flavin reductase (DIM6/NTAB) family NADH-FMN oxidoreductase RutF